MFGIQVSFYFHQFIGNNYNFSKHCYYYIITENYMLQSFFFTVFLFVVRFSCQMPYRPGLLLEASHVKRLVPSYGIFSSRLSVQSRLVQCLIIRGYCQAVSSVRLVPPFGIFSSKLLTFRKIR